MYILEMMKGTNPIFDMENFELLCLDLFKAGAETSSTTILWIILFLTRYQEVQERCHQEVAAVTGEEAPSLRHKLPYCQVLYCTVLYCTVLYCTVLYCTVLAPPQAALLPGRHHGGTEARLRGAADHPAQVAVEVNDLSSRCSFD